MTATATVSGSLSPEAPRTRGDLLLWIEGGTPVRVTDLYLDATTSSAFTAGATVVRPT